MWTAGRGAALLRVLKVMTLAATGVVVLVTGLRGPTPPRLVAGAGASACPIASRTSALVRTPGGRVQVVSFERGWAVFNGRAAGTFLEICPGDD